MLKYYCSVIQTIFSFTYSHSSDIQTIFQGVLFVASWNKYFTIMLKYL